MIEDTFQSDVIFKSIQIHSNPFYPSNNKSINVNVINTAMINEERVHSCDTIQNLICILSPFISSPKFMQNEGGSGKGEESHQIRP